MQRRAGRRGFRRSCSFGLREALAHPLESRLPLVAAPTLVVRGLRDPLVSASWTAPRSLARTIRRFVDEQAAANVAVA